MPVRSVSRARASTPMRVGWWACRKGVAMGPTYVDFENRFRGSSDDVQQEQAPYVAMFHDVPGPVVDLGCGRGEFLALLLDQGIEAWGVDISTEMLQVARARGVDARHQDLREHLESLAEGSVGGFFMGHVVEHLPRTALARLAELVASRLAPGGVVVVETLNPACQFALAPFAMDLTHEWFVHPQTLQFILEAHGLSDFEGRDRQYLPESMLVLRPPDHPPATTPLEKALLAAVGRMQLIVDLAFRNFIYTLVARRRA